jgi:hypothetical protein
MTVMGMPCVFCEVMNVFWNIIYFVFDLLRTKTAVTPLLEGLCMLYVNVRLQMHLHVLHNSNKKQLESEALKGQFSMMSAHDRSPSQLHMHMASASWVTTRKMHFYVRELNFLLPHHVWRVYSGHKKIQVYADFTNSTPT